MAFKFSSGVRKQICFSGPLKTILDGSVVRLYSGVVPQHADSALGSATLLCEIKVGANPVTFEAAGNTATLTKNLSEEWRGDVLVGGTPSFFRLVKESDTGTATDTEVRVQGTVGGPADDLTISNPLLVQGAPQRIEYFAISILEQA